MGRPTTSSASATSVARRMVSQRACRSMGIVGDANGAHRIVAGLGGDTRAMPPGVPTKEERTEEDFHDVQTWRYAFSSLRGGEEYGIDRSNENCSSLASRKIAGN